MYTKTHFWISFLCCVILDSRVVTQTTKCHDTDTAACHLLQNQRPDFCKDDALATALCSKFCNLCPIECYHCNNTYRDYHLCNTTVLCQSEEACMLKELRSFVDGHREFEMTCQDRKKCDGGGSQTIPFGKRHVTSRDILVTCCIDDLCNYPEAGCPKDIIFMVDAGSNHWGTYPYDQALKDVIISIIHRLDIGMEDNLVAFYSFDKDLNTGFELQSYTDKNSIISHINSFQVFNTRNNSIYNTNTSEAIHILVSHLTLGHFGDRPAYPDAIVVIGNELTTTNLKLSASDKQHLQQISRDVIVLDSGRLPDFFYAHSLVRPFDDILATDSNHVIHVNNLQDHPELIVDKLTQLIVRC